MAFGKRTRAETPAEPQPVAQSNELRRTDPRITAAADRLRSVIAQIERVGRFEHAFIAELKAIQEHLTK